MANVTLDNAPYDLIKADQYQYIGNTFLGSFVLLSIFGFCTNALNILIFTKLRSKDSVNFSFLHLSFVDLCCNALILSHVATSFAIRIERAFTLSFYLDPFAILTIFTEVRQLVYSTSSLVTIYIAVARCMCVYKPLHFKDMFTVPRTRKIFLGIWVSTAILYMPSVFVLETKAFYNNTRLRIHFTGVFAVLATIEDIVGNIFLNLGTQVIMVSCLLVLIFSLRKSSQFRQNIKTSGMSDATSKGEQTKQSMTNSKEQAVVMQVLFVSAIFVVCNSPKVVLSLTVVIWPDIDINTPNFKYTYYTAALTRLFFETLNVSCNFFVYFKFNTSFRKAVLSLHIKG